MSLQSMSVDAAPSFAATSQCIRRRAPRAALAAACCAVIVLAATPTVALAHGPVAPVATSYLAKIDSVPAGLEAKIVDGYVRMWLRVPRGETVVVLDYRGAPYLRFTAVGVEVNENSEMYYLNQTPYAWTPPPGLRRTTPPRWQPSSSGQAYEWHDGRLQALASVALAPGRAYVGRWSVPILVDGRPTAISGGLWHAASPSLVWFWPVFVLLACVLAAWRVQSPELDRRVARVLGMAALVALSVACLARELHGRPGVSASQYVELVLVLAFAALQARRVISGRAGYFSYLVIGFVALWQGLELFTTLLDGYVLVTLPAAVVRTATAVCLGSAVGLGLFVFRLEDGETLRRLGRRGHGGGRHEPGRPRGAHRVL
jgi:hypothetical protein